MIQEFCHTLYSHSLYLIKCFYCLVPPTSTSKYMDETMFASVRQLCYWLMVFSSHCYGFEGNKYTKELADILQMDILLETGNGFLIV